MTASSTPSSGPPAVGTSAGSPAADGQSPSLGRAPSGERVVPYNCPFCAEEDLRPHSSAPNAWYCRACLRIFSVKFLGMESNASPVVPTTEYPSTEYGGPS